MFRLVNRTRKLLLHSIENVLTFRYRTIPLRRTRIIKIQLYITVDCEVIRINNITRFNAINTMHHARCYRLFRNQATCAL